jgi:hypothetical protein
MTNKTVEMESAATLSVNLKIKKLGEVKLTLGEAKALHEKLNELFGEKVVQYNGNWWWKPYWCNTQAPLGLENVWGTYTSNSMKGMSQRDLSNTDVGVMNGTTSLKVDEYSINL